MMRLDGGGSEGGCIARRSWYFDQTERPDSLEWHMRAVPTTEAKSRFAELLRVVEYGESIAITRHGKTVAHLVPAVDRERVLQRTAVERFRARRWQWRRIDMTTEEILASIREGRR